MYFEFLDVHSDALVNYFFNTVNLLITIILIEKINTCIQLTTASYKAISSKIIYTDSKLTHLTELIEIATSDEPEEGAVSASAEVSSGSNEEEDDEEYDEEDDDEEYNNYFSYHSDENKVSIYFRGEKDAITDLKDKIIICPQEDVLNSGNAISHNKNSLEFIFKKK